MRVSWRRAWTPAAEFRAVCESVRRTNSESGALELDYFRQFPARVVWVDELLGVEPTAAPSQPVFNDFSDDGRILGHTEAGGRGHRREDQS